MQSWDVALEDLNKVREVIDANVSAQTMFTSLSAWGGGWVGGGMYHMFKKAGGLF